MYRSLYPIIRLVSLSQRTNCPVDAQQTSGPGKGKLSKFDNALEKGKVDQPRVNIKQSMMASCNSPSRKVNDPLVPEKCF